MNFTVVWTKPAQSRLADAWISSPSDVRSLITNAVAGLDRMLGRDPYAVGESRDGITRIAFSLPLSVVYEVHDDDRLVQVLSVRLVKGENKA